MITGSLRGFEDLTPGMSRGGAPMPGPARGVGPVGVKPYSGAPASVTSPAASPAPVPYGQANDPAAYGKPAPSASPLGMWQEWLNTMGPYLAQMPASMPRAESGGLSSLAPAGQYSYGRPPGYLDEVRGFHGARGFYGINAL